MRPTPLKILIVDDHHLMVASIRRVLSEREEVEIVGQASSGNEVLPLVLGLRPDVVLLDIGMPGVDGIECAGLIRTHAPDVRILMLTAYGDPHSVEAARAAGADGYILKSVAAVDLAETIHGSARGDFLVAGFPDFDSDGVSLTKREAAVLEAMCEGLTNRQIGRELWITEQTVKFHLKNLFRKLNASNRREAVKRAHERGLVWAGERRATAAS